MVTTLMNVLADLVVDEPIGWREVRIIPLRLQRMASLEYLTLEDSAAATLLTVEETSTSGSVPELQVRNRTNSRVLIPEGSTLVGAKQNRVVNLSIMIAPESVTLIPVSCVERGRWRFLTPQFAAGGFAGSPLRAQMCKDATVSLKTIGKVHVDQGEVWRHVDDMLEGAEVCSPTAAYHALYEKWQPEFVDCEARLRLPENACGAAVEIDGLLVAVDLFDKPSTLHKLWPKLIRSYLLAVLGSRVPQGKKIDVSAFLARVLSSPGESYNPVGVGTTIRFTHPEAVGAALMCEDQLVHLSVFANGAPHRTSEPPRPEPQARLEPQASEPADPPTQSSARNRWWRWWA
jgi:hypothetical protein